MYDNNIPARVSNDDKSIREPHWSVATVSKMIKPHTTKLLQRLHKLPARLPLGVNNNPHTYSTFWEPNSPRLRLRDNAYRSTELGGDGAEVGNAVQRTEGLIKDVS